ncbi:CueP family metal-binding protein [Janibacter sp. YIM B02568]|uniref:CueP family metal-binding protein n=1 Tax=Janibacter endophyticus TaxID=2806261 RepID=UPI00194F1480|nr:CueP family metal-binding protein [Janibacter endophyticus]MBM6544579.1 CueP family metal-binding protein [Janibacter endophyticus]
MPVRRIAALALSALLLTSCGSGEGTQGGSDAAASSPTATAQDLLAAHDLDGLDTVTLVDRLDRLPVADRPADLMASVRPDVLVVSNSKEGVEHELPMPEERFYLSVAPYVDGTHDCFFHSLTTCRGEMSEEEIDVRIETADGEVLVDETRRTFDNGFVGFWLPRDVEATITLARGDERGSATVTTGDEDLTCLTTVRLA